MSADPAENKQQQQRNRGRFQKGHKGYKPKGATSKLPRGIKEAALRAAAEIGGKGGLKEYFKNNTKLLDDVLRESLPARAKGVLVDSAGDPLDIGDIDTSRSGPVVDTVTIVGIPSGWSVIGLLGQGAHVPSEIVPKLRELLPPGSIGRPPSADNIDPAWSVPSSGDASPLLRVIDGDGGDEPEPPAA